MARRASHAASHVRKDIAAVKEEIRGLQEYIQELLAGGEAEAEDVFYCPDASVDAGRANSSLKLAPRRGLRGHFGKIYSLAWAGNDDPNLLVSASQDGKLIIWNVLSAHKVDIVTLRSSWVMTCAFSATSRMVCSGGLDNTCSVYRVNLDDEITANAPALRPDIELAEHEGYLSCARFVGSTQILTSSGDRTCALWDWTQSRRTTVFQGHSSDVMGLSSSDADPNIFVSGSVDCTCRLWDIRVPHAVATFFGHGSDVNAVTMLGGSDLFVSGSDDATARLFDRRSLRQLNLFQTDGMLCGVTSVDSSSTSKYIVCGYDDNSAVVWDTCNGTIAQTLDGHHERVSCVGVSADGHALATGSWDTSVIVRA